MGDRSWVDSEHCRDFVDNILTAFETRLPPNIRQLTESLPTAPITVAVSVATESMKGECLMRKSGSVIIAGVVCVCLSVCPSV